MSDSTRRGFLKVAGTGAVVAAGVAMVPGTADAATKHTDDPALPASAEGALVAYVKNVREGEVAFMVEGHEVTVTDHKLVARLAHAMHEANRKAGKSAHHSV